MIRLWFDSHLIERRRCGFEGQRSATELACCKAGRNCGVTAAAARWLGGAPSVENAVRFIQGADSGGNLFLGDNTRFFQERSHGGDYEQKPIDPLVDIEEVLGISAAGYRDGGGAKRSSRSIAAAEYVAGHE